MVAMDFTGKDGGRVIENPTEAESAEREEGRAWRVRRWRVRKRGRGLEGGRGLAGEERC